jgi:hypothetical protein
VAAGNAVVANVVLSNLTGPGTWQDLTIAVDLQLIQQFQETQHTALYVNVNTANANGTVDIRVYGDVVSF